MTLNDRARKRMRFILSVVVIGAVLATFSEVRDGICRVATEMIGAVTSDSASVAIPQSRRKFSVRPSMMFSVQPQGLTTAISRYLGSQIVRAAGLHPMVFSHRIQEAQGVKVLGLNHSGG
jgi:hypothetical protein